MTKKQLFYSGAVWTFEHLARHIEENFNGECKTVEERRTFAKKVVNIIEHFDVEHDELLNQYCELNGEFRSVEDKNTFTDGVRAQLRYVQFCIYSHDNILLTCEADIKKYFSGEVSAIPNKYYASFDEYIKAFE